MLSIRLTLKKILQKMKIIDDYVVESSSEGGWTWQKWESGIVHLWGVHWYTNNAIQCATKYGSVYKTTGFLSLEIPFDIVDHQNAAVSASVTAAGADIVSRAQMATANRVQFIWVNPSAYSGGLYNDPRVLIQISGYWKTPNLGGGSS